MVVCPLDEWLPEPGENPNFYIASIHLLGQDERMRFYFILLINSSLGMLFQRLILLRISDSVPLATILWAGTVILWSPSGVAFRSLT